MATSARRLPTPAVPGTPLVIGHRGAATVAPENTAAAFREAAAAGAAFLETDIRLSSDGVPFLLHDEEPDRTTDAVSRGVEPGTLVETLDWATLRALDAGAWFGPSAAGERVARLDEAAEVGIGVDIEIKLPTSHGAGAVVEAVGQALRGPAWAELVERGEVVVTSFDPDVVEAALGRLDVPVGFLVELVPSADDLVVLRDLGVAGVVTDQEMLTADDVARVRAVDLPLWVYTANGAKAWDRMLDLGVDAICTDDPAGLVEHLRLRG